MGNSQDIVSNLLLHYPMNGNADDIGPNNFDVETNALPTTDRWGNFGEALRFDGNGATIILPNDPLLKPQLPLTISFWIKLQEYSQVFTNILTTDYTEDAYYGVWFNTDGQGRPAINYGEGTPGQTNSDNRRSKVGNMILQLNTWYMITGVIRGQTDMDVYVNCEDVGGTYSGIGGPLTYSNNPGNIGRVDIAGGGPYYFKGSLDEFRYWDRALTQEDVEFLYGVDASLFDEITICAGDTITYLNQTISEAGVYNLNGLPGQACSSGVTLTVNTIENNVNFEIEPDTMVLLGEGFNFTYTGSIQNDSLNSLIWNYETGIDTVLSPEFQLTYPDTGTYAITLTAISDSGCVSEITQYVQVVPIEEEEEPEPLTIKIPNVISPNNDGKNDAFVIDVSNPLLNKSIVVFNRWGNLIYENESYNNDWEPNNYPDGVYFYLAEVEQLGKYKGSFQIIKGE